MISLHRFVISTIHGLLILALVSLPATGQDAKTKPLPEGVEKKPVTIWSDGVRMVGDLYLPTELKKDEKLPVIIFCAGTGGTRKGTAEKMAPHFVRAGYAFLAFDYRGWGDSDGKLITLEKQPRPNEKGEIAVNARVVRWQMDFADQTQDIRSAISFISGEPNIDKDRIGILGTSYGGGLVTWVAGNDPRVKCVVAQVPGMGGIRAPAGRKAVQELATKQARAEIEPVPFETGKLGGKLAVYGQMRSNPVKSLGYSALEAAEKIKAPMFIVMAEKEELLDNTTNGGKVYDILKKRNVPTETHMLKGVGHYGVYRESFPEAIKLEIEWFNKHLKSAASQR